jgi:hypothetical protein
MDFETGLRAGYAEMYLKISQSEKLFRCAGSLIKVIYLTVFFGKVYRLRIFPKQEKTTN